MKAFITGSHVYGRPTTKSYIDLVVFMDQFAADKLREKSESSTTVRFGRLNIILCFSEDEFNAWKTTTDRLAKMRRETGATFDKVAAHAEFEKDRSVFGVNYNGDSGQEYSPEDGRSVLPKAAAVNPNDPFSGVL